MSANNSKPKQPPVVVLREDPSNFGRYMLLMLPALLGSFIFHVALVAIFFLYVVAFQSGQEPTQTETTSTTTVTADQVEDKKETFTVVDVDPAAVEFDTDIQYNVTRIEDVSVPGAVDPNAPAGIEGGTKTPEMFNIPAPGGFGSSGQGGAIESLTGIGNSNAVGKEGGYGPRGLPLDKTFAGRSGATREQSLREGGGTTASEAAVTRGLQWLIRQQATDGRWTLAGTNDPNPIAATAMGLLPFLAAGKTHKAADKNPYDKNIDKGLKLLMSQQNTKTGFFGGTMYSHGLATIAMCEAYGLSQDPTLRKSAQRGIDLIVSAQGETTGSWDYGPAKSARADMSVSGWQIMALKSGQMAGLNVPAVTITRVKGFLNTACNTGDDGYGYTPGSGSSPRMSAVGLLCRQYMENWGPSNLSMINGVKKHIKTTPPDVQDVYYYYYATQVIHHFGGSDWKDWNEKMRENLIRKQDVAKGANYGSWSPAGDPWGGSGGRLMITSLNLLTLEVYYRYLPLYYRDAGYAKDKVVQKSLE
jgi:hypothetical protein